MRKTEINTWIVLMEGLLILERWSLIILNLCNSSPGLKVWFKLKPSVVWTGQTEKINNNNNRRKQTKFDDEIIGCCCLKTSILVRIIIFLLLLLILLQQLFLVFCSHWIIFVFFFFFFDHQEYQISTISKASKLEQNNTRIPLYSIWGGFFFYIYILTILQVQGMS